jgi:hypothetical protein
VENLLAVGEYPAEGPVQGEEEGEGQGGNQNAGEYGYHNGGGLGAQTEDGQPLFTEASAQEVAEIRDKSRQYE